MKNWFIVSFTLAALSALLFGCAQSEVVADKLIDKLNKVIGEYDVKIKQHEHALQNMRKRYENAIEAKHLSIATGDQWKKKLDMTNKNVEFLKSKRDAIDDVVKAGAPYKDKEGKEYTEAEIQALLQEADTAITTQSERAKTYANFVGTWENLTTKSQTLQERLKKSMADSSAALQMLKDKVEMLKLTTEQVKTAPTITEDITLSSDSLLKEIANTDVKVSAKLGAQTEILDDLLSTSSSLSSIEGKLGSF